MPLFLFPCGTALLPQSLHRRGTTTRNSWLSKHFAVLLIKHHAVVFHFSGAQRFSQQKLQPVFFSRPKYVPKHSCCVSNSASEPNAQQSHHGAPHPGSATRWCSSGITCAQPAAGAKQLHRAPRIPARWSSAAVSRAGAAAHHPAAPSFSLASIRERRANCCTRSESAAHGLQQRHGAPDRSFPPRPPCRRAAPSRAVLCRWPRAGGAGWGLRTPCPEAATCGLWGAASSAGKMQSGRAKSGCPSWFRLCLVSVQADGSYGWGPAGRNPAVAATAMHTAPGASTQHSSCSHRASCIPTPRPRVTSSTREV